MDIQSGKGWPAAALSNFAPHPFIFRGVQCNSMEGLLQSLKFENPEMQKVVCTLIGLKAKFRGKKKNWWSTQTLFWQGTPIDRHSEVYQQLLDEAFQEMFRQSEAFRKALKATNNAVLTHSIGKTDKSHTILTQQEFCSRLMRLRDGFISSL